MKGFGYALFNEYVLGKDILSDGDILGITGHGFSNVVTLIETESDK
ncbi:MAG: hypothetical protein GYA36_22705 [Veillonellaceae bacterium]|nr:hypothetical protein [Veillonellaceae bacterium]